MPVMKLTPEFDQFEKNYNKNINQLVYCRLAADLDTPVSNAEIDEWRREFFYS